MVSAAAAAEIDQARQESPRPLESSRDASILASVELDFLGADLDANSDVCGPNSWIVALLHQIHEQFCGIFVARLT